MAAEIGTDGVIGTGEQSGMLMTFTSIRNHKAFTSDSMGYTHASHSQAITDVPRIGIDLRWADEDVGYNVGHVVL